MGASCRMNLLTKVFHKKKYVSEFVKRQRELQSKIAYKVLWLSKPAEKLAGITYVRKLHGELK